MKSNVSNPCPDCGQNPVNHANEWMSALIESAMTPVGIIIDRTTAGVRAFLIPQSADRAAPPFYRLLAALRLGTLIDDVDEHDSGRNRWLWDSAKRRGIVMQQFRMLGRPDGMNIFIAARDGKVVAFEGLPRPDSRVSPALNWMDNKAVMKKKFAAVGIPVARGRACATYSQAVQTFREVGGPVIVKPHIGSRGRHTTVHINDEEALRTAFRSAKKLSPWTMVEQELKGRVFRILLVDRKVAAVVRREEPHVVGDGKQTIRTLIENENKNPMRKGSTFHELRIDDDAEQELARQNVTWNSIPEKGEMISLNTHVSRYYGASTTDFTDRVHPDNIALFEKIGKVLDDSLVGIDFIIEDMERSWRDQPLCGVIECNSLPNIDLHHDVLYGQNRDIAGMLLDVAFKK